MFPRKSNGKIDLRLFKTRYEGFIGLENSVMFMFQIDEIGHRMSVANCTNEIINQSLAHEMMEQDDEICFMVITKQHRLFGVPLTPKMTVIEYDTDDY